MLFTTHIIVGATIGEATGEPVSAFALGFASHHLLDSIPHFDAGSFDVGKKPGGQWQPQHWFMAFADVVLGIGIVTLLFLVNPVSYSLISGALGAAMPDIIDNVPWTKKLVRSTKIGKIYHFFHAKYHRTTAMRQIALGLGLQLLIIILCFSYMIFGVHK